MLIPSSLKGQDASDARALSLGAGHELSQYGLAFVRDYDRSASKIFIEKGEQLDEKAAHRVRAFSFELQQNKRWPRSRLGFHQSSQSLVSGEYHAILQKGQLQYLGQRKISGTDLDGVNRVVAGSLELLDDQYRK